MSSPYRTLERNELRAVLDDERFATPAAGIENFELGCDRFAVRWDGGAPRLATVHGPGGTHDTVARVAAECGLALAPAGERPGPGGGFYFGVGGQLGLATTGATPRAAVEALERALVATARALGADGIELIALGQSPWHAPDELSVAGGPAAEPFLSLDQLFGEADALGRAVLRSAGTHVRIGFGGAVQRPLRWRAAELAAPVATAMFASSPMWCGSHDGFKSQRARARQSVDPSRTGWAPQVPGEPASDRVGAYLELALGARIVGVNHGGCWVPPLRPLSFEQWMEYGVEGRYPDLDDWRAHLDSLEPEVVPFAGVELRGLDALPGPFQAVPLVFLTALLTEPSTAQAVIDRLEPGADQLRSRWELAARSGLLEVDLAEDAAWLFGRAAEALLRLPEGWFSGPLLAAFVAFGRRFAQRGLTPADEIMDLFLERGRFGQAELAELDGRWRRVTGQDLAA